MKTTHHYHTLQSLLFPEFGVSTEQKLYMHLNNLAWFSEDTRHIGFGAGGVAAFNTSFNLFNLGKWRRSCDLKDLALRLQGEGEFELAVYHVVPDRPKECLVNRIVTLTPDTVVDLSDRLRHAKASVVFFKLKAVGNAKLTEAEFVTRDTPRRMPKIALSITTFKREEAVRATVARFEAYMEHSPLREHLHLFVVDNGRSAEIENSRNVTAIGNENLGGSGGFARGLLEAEAAGYSHCQFMDDDASVHMDAMLRVWAFLAYAVDDRTAVNGALTMGNCSWRVWENGAVFRFFCRPLWRGLDLRSFGQSLEMEIGSTGPNEKGYYGGWWFCCFPINHAVVRPFPFFVRGDDLNFSLANDFEFVTLPGVVCFQDEDFADKETPLTRYLDLRNHLVQNLSLPSEAVSRVEIMKAPARFFGNALVKMHYETMEALNISLEDVLTGPQFFAENADMAERRQRLNGLRQREIWAATETIPDTRRKFDPRGPHLRHRVARQVLKYSLNGHLLPFYGWWGNKVTIPMAVRHEHHQIWGAAEATYVNGAQDKTYTVRHSKAAAARQLWRMSKNLSRLFLNYAEVQQMWREGHKKIATTEFWRGKFGM